MRFFDRTAIAFVFLGVFTMAIALGVQLTPGDMTTKPTLLRIPGVGSVLVVTCYPAILIGGPWPTASSATTCAMNGQTVLFSPPGL